MLQKLKKEDFELTREQQKKLFEITYAREEAETKRLVKKYFNIEWEKLHPKIQQILVDLKFRGDFLPTSKAEGHKALKAAVEANDLEAFKKVHLSYLIFTLHTLVRTKFSQTCRGFTVSYLNI